MLDKLIKKMYERSGGRKPLKTCGNCDYMVSFKRSGRNVYKCLMSGDDGTPCTDWDKSLEACLWHKERKAAACINKDDNEIDGQMNIFDYLK